MDDPIIRGEPTVFIGPPGVDVGALPFDVYDPDGPWELIFPTVPDHVPDDLLDDRR